MFKRRTERRCLETEALNTAISLTNKYWAAPAFADKKARNLIGGGLVWSSNDYGGGVADADDGVRTTTTDEALDSPAHILLR